LLAERIKALQGGSDVIGSRTLPAVVERYAPLIWSICRRHWLGADAVDVGQSVWLKIVDQLSNLRDSAALAGWLATTTRRECGRILRTAWGHPAPGRQVTPGPAMPPRHAHSRRAAPCRDQIQAAIDRGGFMASGEAKVRLMLSAAGYRRDGRDCWRGVLLLSPRPARLYGAARGAAGGALVLHGPVPGRDDRPRPDPGRRRRPGHWQRAHPRPARSRRCPRVRLRRA
jgi:DNA-directed RNA polymerase specialized sigma24 family protein